MVDRGERDGVPRPCERIHLARDDDVNKSRQGPPDCGNIPISDELGLTGHPPEQAEWPSHHYCRIQMRLSTSPNPSLDQIPQAISGKQFILRAPTSAGWEARHPSTSRQGVRISEGTWGMMC